MSDIHEDPEMDLSGGIFLLSMSRLSMIPSSNMLAVQI